MEMRQARRLLQGRACVTVVKCPQIDAAHSLAYHSAAILLFSAEVADLQRCGSMAPNTGVQLEAIVGFGAGETQVPHRASWLLCQKDPQRNLDDANQSVRKVCESIHQALIFCTSPGFWHRH